MQSLIKPLAFLFVAAQLLLAVPAMASANLGQDAPACHEMGGMNPAPGDATDAHPCCPDGTDSTASCLVSCALGAAVSTQTHVVQIKAARIEAQALPPAFIAVAAPPPLKPPPII